LSGQYKNIHKLMKNMEMPEEWLPKLAAYCRKKKIEFLCTPFDTRSADLLKKIRIAAYKIASSECNYVQLIEHIAKIKKPILLSTGITEIEEINTSVKVIKKYHNSFALFHTIVNYPAKIKDANLPYIKILQKKFDCPAGLSDHSYDPIILPVAATALGANIIEKHFTLDRSLPGPDHKFALVPSDLKAMVKAVRQVEAAMIFKKGLPESEKEFIKVSKRAIQAARDIKKGERISAENIVILRAGKGLKKGMAPRFYGSIIGKISLKNIKEGEGINKDYIK